MLLASQHFVGINVLLTQILIWGVGLLLLSAYYRRERLLLSCAMAYPIGTIIAGTIQWTVFIIGKSEWGMVVFLGFVLTTVVWWLKSGELRAKSGELRGRDRRPETTDQQTNTPTHQCTNRQLLPPSFPHRPLSPGYIKWFAIVLICIMALVGYFIMQSSDVGESDPRWQWAYRAKIMASFSGYDLPQFKDSTVHHINRKYPLMYCGVGALSMRMLGTPKCHTVFRAINYGFFISFLLLLYAYAKHQGSWLGLLFVLFALSVTPHFWAMAIDENYVDFPLGVLAALWVVVMVERRAKGLERRVDSGRWAEGSGMWRWLPGIILGVGIVGFKAEGVLLFAAAVAGVVAMLLFSKQLLAASMTVAVAGGAFVIAMVLTYTGQAQIATDAGMANVSLSDFSMQRFIENLDRLPTILNAFLMKYSLNLRKLGLLIPFIILGAMWSRRRILPVILITSFTYLFLMTIPFIVTPWADLTLHLQTVTSRMWWHIIPVLCLGLGCSEHKS